MQTREVIRRLRQEQVHFGMLFVYMIMVFGQGWIMREVIENHFSRHYHFGSLDFSLGVEIYCGECLFRLLLSPSSQLGRARYRSLHHGRCRTLSHHDGVDLNIGIPRRCQAAPRLI